MPPLIEAELAPVGHDSSTASLEHHHHQGELQPPPLYPLASASTLSEKDLITPAKRRRMRIISISLVFFVVALIASVTSSVLIIRNKKRAITDGTTIIWRFDELTVVIQLDENPEETGWGMNCGEPVVDDIEFPPGSYKG